MEFWKRLAASALLGTERGLFELPPMEGELGEALAALDASDPEAALLGAASVLSVYRAAGMAAPVEKAPAPEAAPEDDSPECGARASKLLERLLLENQSALLPEWLDACAGAGQRVESRLLPALLDEGTKSKARREAIRRVAGARGRWLAAQNPEWAWGAPEDAAARSASALETFQLGQGKARADALRELRAADPAAALATLERSWKQETAAERTLFAEALETGLGPGDEPFLEAALDDRSKNVARVAAALLARLPESAFAQRAAERLRQCVKAAPDKSGGLAIEVELPGELTPEMKRDGMEEKPPHRVGQRAWWLFQIVASAPLSFWEAEFGASAGRLALAAAEHKNWAAPLLGGMGEAARRQRRGDWAMAALERARSLAGSIASGAKASTQAELEEAKVAGAAYNALLDWRTLPGVLSPEEFERFGLALVEAGHDGLGEFVSLFRLSEHFEPLSMSERLGEAILAALGGALKTSPYDDNAFSCDVSALKNLGRVLPASLAERVDGWKLNGEIDSYWENSVEHVASLLQTRRGIAEAFSDHDS